MTDAPHPQNPKSPDTPDPALEPTSPTKAADDNLATTAADLAEPTRATAPKNKLRKRSAKDLQAIRNLWIVIGGLTFVLIIVMLIRKPAAPPTPASNPAADLAMAGAELEISLAEINRQRAEMGHPPLPSIAEGPGKIAARLSQDAETLVALIDRYQRIISDKQREISEKNVEILRAGQRNEELTMELAAARTQPAGDSGAAAQLEAELAEVLTRSNRLAEELADARRQLAEVEAAPPPSDEVDILNRRLEEAKRARDFFEERARQLEERFNHIPDGVEIDDEEIIEE